MGPLDNEGSLKLSNRTKNVKYKASACRGRIDSLTETSEVDSPAVELSNNVN
jgi:hypothetical protein